MALEKILKNSSGIPTGEYERISGGTLYADTPVGVIQSFGGSAIPTGWLLCDGAEVLKTDYAELYAVIGDAFGTASVNTKFVLPDLREATTKGVGLTGKSNNHYDSDGVALGEFIDDRIQRHAHMYNLATGSGTTWIAAQKEANIIQEITTGPVAEYGTGDTIRKGATTEVKSVGVNYIIKSKQVALPADLESAVEERLANPTVERLFAGLVATSLTDYTLSKDITQYRELLFVTQGGSGLDVGNSSEFMDTIPVKAFIELCTDISNFMAMFTRQGSSSSTWWLRVKYKDSTHLSMYIGTGWVSDYVYIYGIK